MLPALAAIASIPAPATASAPAGTRSFQSEPWLHPPIVTVQGRVPDPLASGDIFADVQNAVLPGPVILGPAGQLIWFDQLPSPLYAYNVAVQQYMGEPVLTFWEGHGGGFGSGYDVILNQAYQQIATVRAPPGYQTDSHDFEILPNGDALITARRQAHADLRAVGGARGGLVRDDLVQEIDIATGGLVWQWDALQHVQVADSYAGRPTTGSPYDFFHINAVQQLPDGNLLVSARHTWAVYDVSRQTGKIVWTLGGKHSSFAIGPGANFEWQHDARMPKAGVITVFDDGAGLTSNENESRALRIRLNFRTRRATLVRALVANPPLLALSQGSVQSLPDGNTFVGWGNEPYFTEFGHRGRQLFSLSFPSPMQSYRGFRFQWSGQPAAPPDLAVSPTPTGTRVWASWNGATDVADWRVLAGSSPTALTQVEQFARTQFETASWAESTDPYFAVQAIGSLGQILSTSTTVQR